MTYPWATSLEQAVSRLKLHPLLGDISITANYSPPTCTTTIKFTRQTFSADSADSLIKIPIERSLDLPVDMANKIPTTRRSFAEWVRDQLVEFFTHEICEAIRIDGERVLDPHPVPERKSRPRKRK